MLFVVPIVCPTGFVAAGRSKRPVVSRAGRRWNRRAFSPWSAAGAIRKSTGCGISKTSSPTGEALAASAVHSRQKEDIDMAKMQKKTFAQPDEKRKFDKGLLELISLGGVTFGRGTFEPGWRWSTSIK